LKRVDLIKAIEGLGCEFIRDGGKHDWYRNPLTGVTQPVPRHREIRENLAKRIFKMLGDPGGGGRTGAAPGQTPA